MKTLLFASTLSLALVSGLRAQEVRSGGRTLINDVEQSAVALHPATPFLESSSLLLADINLEKIDVVAVMQWLEQFTGKAPAKEQSEMVRGFIDSLQGGGVSHLYVSAATRSAMDGGPIVIIPCQNPAVVNGLSTVLIQRAPPQSPQKVHVGDKIVVVGAEAAIDRVVAREGVLRPDLILPLKGSDLLDHNLVIALPSDAREELEAFWPDKHSPKYLPFPISPRQIAQDVSRLIVSLRLPPEPEMVIQIETTDAGAAERIQTLARRALAMTGDVESMIELKVELATVTLRAAPDTFVKIASTMLAPARASATRLSKMNSIKQIGLGLHNYHAANKHLPPRCFIDSDGEPVMSWRVAILPYVDQAAMYRAMKLDEQWDSEDNHQFSATLIPVFNDKPELRNRTTLRVPVYPGSLWHGEGAPKGFRDVRDGTSNTIAVIDAPESAAVEWANPQPWVISTEDPISDIFGDRDEVSVGFLDGSARVLRRDEMTNDKLKAMLTIAGGEALD